MPGGRGNGNENDDDGPLGWNAVDCCGEPMTNDVDDLDFVVNGVMGVFVDNLLGDGTAATTAGDGDRSTTGRENDGDDGDDRGDAIAIVTGFSNGGFLSSLLGLMPSTTGGYRRRSTTVVRPPWLVGIVPTGGYQYDVGLYVGGDVLPLPLMSHHGGMDSVVDPDGCCNTTSSTDGGIASTSSNCPLDIGIKRDACTSVRSAFDMWSNINGCYETILYDDSANINDEGTDREDRQRRHIHTCYGGVGCIEPTNLCIWNEEGHSWGNQFPGTDMTQRWMGDVFSRAELRNRRVVNDRRYGGGRFGFASAVTLIIVLLLCTIVCSSRFGKLHCLFLGRGRKRKTSEGYEETEIAEMM